MRSSIFSSSISVVSSFLLAHHGLAAFSAATLRGSADRFSSLDRAFDRDKSKAQSPLSAS